MGTVPGRRGRGTGRPAAVLAAAVVGLSACAESRPAGPAERAATPSVTAACRRLATLADALAGTGDAASRPEIRRAAALPFQEFVAAAAASGDDELAGTATLAQARFQVYLTSEGVPGSRAQAEADQALARAGDRCRALGAAVDLPGRP